LDKTPVYPGAIPLDTNILQPQRNVEIALGFIMQAAFGTSTVIDGLAVVPTGPASMQVKVGPGSIIFATTVDTLTSGFGSLPLDNSDALVKIGVNLTSTTMSALTAPGTAGQSQNWLLEAQFIEADGTPVVLPYYNAANPSVPFTGPGNAGTTNNTARTNRVQLQWKGGTAATTGTQNTPTPDSGWVGVAIVTVANGQSTIIAGNITPYSSAPYVPTKLPLQRTKLQADLNIYVSQAAGASDTANSGLSAASPFATLQKAWNVVVTNYDLNGFNVVINLASGTYTGGVTCSGSPPGLGTGNTIGFVGNVGSPSSVTVSSSTGHCISATNGAIIQVSGVTLTASGAGHTCLFASAASRLLAFNVVFATCASNHIFAVFGGQIQMTGSYSITGAAAVHYSAQTSGIVILTSGITVTITGTPAFTSQFVNIDLMSIFQAAGVTFSGSATGTRYLASANSVINTSGAGATYFPGSVAGSVQTGGQYV
jgi:hypothetical protein